MWTTEVRASQLRRNGRWKVDFFYSASTRKHRNGFPWSALTNIVRERKETTDPQTNPEEPMNYIGLQNIESGTGDLMDFSPKYGKEIRSRSKHFEEGDILYGRLRPYLNKVFLAADNVCTGICSGEFYVLAPNRDLVLPVYLRAILASEYVQQHVINLQTGSSLPRLQIQDLLEIEVPLPPLERQRDFEKYILSQDQKRKRLKEDLATLEHGMPRKLIQAIERGTTPSLPPDQTHR